MFSTSAMSNCFLCWTFISSFNAVFTAAQSKSFIVKSMFAYVLSNLLDPFYFFSFVFFFFFLFSFYCFIHAILFSLIGFMSVLLLSQFIRVAQRYFTTGFFAFRRVLWPYERNKKLTAYGVLVQLHLYSSCFNRNSLYEPNYKNPYFHS